MKWFGRKAGRVGNRRFRLKRLLRGRRGTEWAAVSHMVGEPFVVIEAATLLAIEPPVAMLGAEARLLASGLGDVTPVAATRIVAGEAMRPPASVHLTARRDDSGDIAITWVRRSRVGWAWLSGNDAPLGEESESYSVGLSGAGFARNLTVSEPSYHYTAAEQAADGLAGTLAIAVAQIGTAAQSRPALLDFN
jgi:hypothetical protein